MTEQDMIDRGTAAGELAKHPLFLAVANTLMDTYLGSIVNTAPTEGETREKAYYQIKGLQDIFAVLNQWVSVKDQILESRKENDESTEETNFEG
jgi:hypothetical protein